MTELLYYAAGIAVGAICAREFYRESLREKDCIIRAVSHGLFAAGQRVGELERELGREPVEDGPVEDYDWSAIGIGGNP